MCVHVYVCTVYVFLTTSSLCRFFRKKDKDKNDVSEMQSTMGVGVSLSVFFPQVNFISFYNRDYIL